MTDINRNQDPMDEFSLDALDLDSLELNDNAPTTPNSTANDINLDTSNLDELDSLDNHAPTTPNTDVTVNFDDFDLDVPATHENIDVNAVDLDSVDLNAVDLNTPDIDTLNPNSNVATDAPVSTHSMTNDIDELDLDDLLAPAAATAVGAGVATVALNNDDKPTAATNAKPEKKGCLAKVQKWINQKLRKKVYSAKIPKK